MKFFMSSIFTSVLLFSLSACGNSSEGTTTQNQTQPITANSTHNTSKTNNTSGGSTQSGQSSSTNINNSSHPKQGSQEAFYGKWQIKKAVAFGPAGTYSSENIKALTGKILTFSKESATCFGDQMDSLNNTIINPVYKTNVVSKSDFSSDFRVTFDQIGINADSVTEIDATDTKGICTVFFITQDSSKLILYGGGTFFELGRFLKN